jgi:Fur family ferric uptake transcriptional regulator
MIAATHSNHPIATVAAATPRTSPLQEARACIRQAKMRITKPRIAIIESLLQHKGPISIERIHHDVGAAVCDLVTVYRCLAAFETLNIVRRSYSHNGTCLYELSLGRDRHYHIVCKACGETERLDYSPVEGVERMLQDRGYTQISHVIEFFGVCTACQKTSSRAHGIKTGKSKRLIVATPSH